MLARRIVLLCIGSLLLVLVLSGLLRLGGDEPAASVNPPNAHGEARIETGEPTRPGSVESGATREALSSEVTAANPVAAEARSVRLHGRVTHEDGAPCVYAEMRLLGDKRSPVAYTSHTGSYEFHAVLTTGLQLEASVIQHERQRVQIDAATTASELQYDFVMKELQGLNVCVISPDGEPLSVTDLQRGVGAQRIWYDVFVSDFDPVADTSRSAGSLYVDLLHQEVGRLWRDQTRRNGSRLPGSIGTVFLEGELPRWVSLVVQDQVVACEQITDPTLDRVIFTVSIDDLRSRCRSLRGSIVDAETRMPLDARLVVLRSGTIAWDRQVEAGWFEVPCLGPRENELIVSAPGYARLRRDVSLQAVGAHDLGTLELQRPVTISGTVERPDGVTNDSVELELTRLESTNPDEVVRLNARFGEPFVFEGLEPTTYVLCAVRIERGPAREILTRRLSAPRVVDAGAGSINGVALRLEDATWLELAYEYRDEEPFPVCTVFDGRGVRALRVELMGEERRVGLLPGDYTLEVCAYGEPVRTARVRVPTQGTRLELD